MKLVISVLSLSIALAVLAIAVQAGPPSLVNSQSSPYPTDQNSKVITKGAYGPSGAEKVLENEHHKSFAIKTFESFADFISQPAKLVVTICEYFKLPIKRVYEFIGKNLIIGQEALMRPVVASIKILEKVFVPDACKLRYNCQIGKYLEFARKQVLLFSPKILQESEYIKALTDGIIGQNCDVVYDNCELRLKPELEKLREEHKHEHYNDKHKPIKQKEDKYHNQQQAKPQQQNYKPLQQIYKLPQQQQQPLKTTQKPLSYQPQLPPQKYQSQQPKIESSSYNNVQKQQAQKPHYDKQNIKQQQNSKQTQTPLQTQTQTKKVNQPDDEDGDDE